ncbi:MAG: hypothetical protein AB7K24_16020 [Gemmataceae bacterium]
MKVYLWIALASCSLATGCFGLPIKSMMMPETEPCVPNAPEPVRADDITVDNAHQKARQLAAELDRAELEGESKPKSSDQSKSKAAKKR